MKVITKDFQRLKGVNEFEFPVGITIVQGRSGSGKSTLFYAVEDCLSNPSGVADVINWDAKSAEVTIENNDNKVKWIKTASSCEYEDKDGKSYIKASKIDSRNLADLGFYFDKKDNIVNIHNEWDIIFPFGSSDTEMFKLFEDIFNISCSFQIIDNIKKDEQDCKSRINDINKQLNEITIQNNQIQGVVERIDPNIDRFINDIQEKEKSVNSITSDYSLLLDSQKHTTLNIPDEYTADFSSKGYYDQILNDYNNLLNQKRLSEILIPESKDFEIVENPYISDYNAYSSIIKQIEEYDKVLSQIALDELSVKEKLKDIKICPTCGQEIKEGILEG